MELKRITFKASDELDKLLNKHTERRGDKNKSELIRELLEKGFRNKAIENCLDLINRKSNQIMEDQIRVKRDIVRANLGVNMLLEYISEDDKAYDSYMSRLKEKMEAIFNTPKEK